VNINLTDNLNVFGNFAHAERFVDLGVYYNQGRVDPLVEDEKSDQIEAGLGWASPTLNAKVNGYWMTWRTNPPITDLSKAGEPGTTEW
jgi:outer membrane receptor protein involved in Fe transport